MNVEAASRSIASAARASSPIIEVAHLEKIFVTVRNERVHALHDISLAVREREFVTVVGPSGCGKTTLLKILAGLVPATAGTVSVDGRPVAAPRRDIGIVFQNPVLLPWRTVMENVLLPAEVQGIPLGEARHAGARPVEDGRPRRVRGQVSDGAVGRHAAARRHQPRAGERPAPAADGRAVRRARCHDARADEPRPAAHLARERQDRAAHHPLDSRGGVPGRPRRGDDAAPGPHRPRGRGCRCRARARSTPWASRCSGSSPAKSADCSMATAPRTRAERGRCRASGGLS